MRTATKEETPAIKQKKLRKEIARKRHDRDDNLALIFSLVLFAVSIISIMSWK